MPATTVLPSISTLPLPDDAKLLFSHAVMLAQRPEISTPVKPWIDQQYRDAVAEERLLPAQQKDWDCRDHELKTAPSASELKAFKAFKRIPRDNAGQPINTGRPFWRDAGFTPQDWRKKREWVAQHKEAAKHPNYLPIMARRHQELQSLQAERNTWKPSLKDRLLLAVTDIVQAPYPSSPEQRRVEHARRVVAIASLLMPEPLPLLGDLGDWRFESVLALPEKPTGSKWQDNLIDSMRALPKEYQPTTYDPRIEGRGEVMFAKRSKDLEIVRGFPAERLLSLLAVAVSDLEGMALPVAQGIATPKNPAMESDATTITAAINNMSEQAKIIAFLRDHPKWTGQRIAKELGISRSTLYARHKDVGTWMKAAKDSQKGEIKRKSQTE